MIEINSILCPVDFSGYSDLAVHHASMIARWYDASVVLFHAHGANPLDLEAASHLERSAWTLRDAGVRVTKKLHEGAAVPAILDAARSLRADLVVMGTHGHSGWDHLVLGSVTEKVLRKVSCPVLTVPPTAFPPPTAAPLGYERIVCAVDFSEWSMKSLRYAASLADESAATLIALHVIDAVHTDRLTAYPSFDVTLYMQHLEENARDRLRQAVPPNDGGWTHEELLATGRPHEEIVRVARERHAHVIVMGVHGRAALDLTLFGSTTHHVIRTAPCPVLTLRG